MVIVLMAVLKSGEVAISVSGTKPYMGEMKIT